MRVPISCSAVTASGAGAARVAANAPFGVGANPVAEARVPVALPSVKIQFSHRNSKAPLWRTPNCPALLIASTGTMAARLGALVMPIACWLAPEYDVPTVPTLLLDHGCSANPFQQVRPIGPIVANRTPRAFRSVSASNILEHDDVAARNEILGQGACGAVLVVDGPLDNRRVATGSRAASPRCIDVGRQANAVASRDGGTIMRLSGRDVVVASSAAGTRPAAGSSRRPPFFQSRRRSSCRRGRVRSRTSPGPVGRGRVETS